MEPIIYGLIIVFALVLLITGVIIYFIMRYSDKIILRWYNAREAEEESEFSKILHSFAEKSGIPCPKLYTIESSMPNVFSLGKCPENASIVITTDAIKLLNSEELESVFAHEMFHIKSKDTRTATITAALGGILTASATFALFGAMFLGFGQSSDPAPRLIRLFTMSLFAPHAAFIIHLTKPGSREYAADEYSVKLCRKSEKLASALKKMEGVKLQMNPAHAHLFIINPLNDEIFNSLFDTHPSTEKRVKHLNELTA